VEIGVDTSLAPARRRLRPALNPDKPPLREERVRTRQSGSGIRPPRPISGVLLHGRVISMGLNFETGHLYSLTQFSSLSRRPLVWLDPRGIQYRASSERGVRIRREAVPSSNVNPCHSSSVTCRSFARHEMKEKILSHFSKRRSTVSQLAVVPSPTNTSTCTPIDPASSISQHLRAAREILQDATSDAKYV